MDYKSAVDYAKRLREDLDIFEITSKVAKEYLVTRPHAREHYAAFPGYRLYATVKVKSVVKKITSESTE
jgi:hypothetical protein